MCDAGCVACDAVCVACAYWCGRRHDDATVVRRRKLSGILSCFVLSSVFGREIRTRLLCIIDLYFATTSDDILNMLMLVLVDEQIMYTPYVKC